VAPGDLAVDGEIVGISLRSDLPFLGFLHNIVDAQTVSMSDRVFTRIEVQADLRHGIASPRPPHQRIELLAARGFELQQPFVGLPAPGLHGSLGGLINASLHCTQSLK